MATALNRIRASEGDILEKDDRGIFGCLFRRKVMIVRLSDDRNAGGDWRGGRQVPTIKREMTCDVLFVTQEQRRRITKTGVGSVEEGFDMDSKLRSKVLLGDVKRRLKVL